MSVPHACPPRFESDFVAKRLFFYLEVAAKSLGMELGLHTEKGG